MTTIKDVLDGHPYCRSIKFNVVRKQVDVPKGYCRYCGNKIVQQGRRLWCSDDCVDEYLFRTKGSEVRKVIGKRDKGICADCGRDTKIIERLMSRNKRIYSLVNWFKKRTYKKLIASGLHKIVAKPRSEKASDEFQDMIAPRISVKVDVARKRYADQGFSVGHIKVGPPRSLWEAHHILPVHKGGGMPSEPEAYKTLCTACHKAIHKQDKKRVT